MAKTITANFPARKGTWSGKPHTFEAHTNVYTQDDAGRWSIFACGENQPMSQADVIADCKLASNWQTIMTEHFPMQFAKLQSGE